MKVFAAAVSMSLFACVVPDTSEQVSDIPQYVIASNCDEPGCGMNSPEIANVKFWDLHVNGVPNDQGFWIESFEKNGVVYNLSVSKGRIKGVSRSGTIAGTNLQGARLHIRHDDIPGGVVIRIATVGYWDFWADNGTTVKVETYGFEWAIELEFAGGTGQTFKNLCSNPPVRGLDTLNSDPTQTVVFEGERISASAKTIGATLDTNWFNLGCAGSALSKLHFTGHTYAAWLAANFYTTIPERQTMLKMLSADYCGTGQAFTVQGTPLDWIDDHHWMSAAYVQQQLEARWTPDGAACLNVPRLDANPSDLSKDNWTSETFPFVYDIYQDVANHCARLRKPMPPPCETGVHPSYHLSSANPILPPPGS